MDKIKYLKIAAILLFLTTCELRLTMDDVYAQDKIVAIVNEDVITKRDLDEFIVFTRIQLSREYKGRELETKLQSMKLDLLNKLIEDRLILQEAKRNKIIINEERVKARINDIKKRYPADAEFQKDLAKQGLSQADLETRIREQLLMYVVVENKVRRYITVTPDEVTSFYNRNIDKFKTQEEREAEVIAFENEDLAKGFYYEYTRGEKLVDLATKYPFTINILKVSYGRQEVRKEIEDVIFKLGIGEVSSPVDMDGKFYVFKLQNIIPPRQQTLAQVQDEIHDILFDEKMQEKMTRWLDEIKAKSYIKITPN